MSSIEANILLVKAERKLKHAERGFEEEDYDSTVGDSYRCIELCMRSLLLAHGFSAIPKTHGGLLQAFSKEIVLKEIFPKDVAKEISGIISLRARATMLPYLLVEKKPLRASSESNFNSRDSP